MPRFIAVDGLRAWLAWIVVVSHVVQESGLQDGGRFWHAVFDSGNWAVHAFIIISGFVITHLLLERKEPYRAYIVRRFMRLYPGFVASCIFGAAAYWGAARFGSQVWFAKINSAQFNAQTQHLSANILAHMAMIHGLIPNDLLPRSEYAFLPPGWSVSLEWQFYLIAPLLISCFKPLKRLFSTALVVSIIIFSYSHWLAFHWLQPSIILGTAQYFFFGMLSRFAVAGEYGEFRLPVPLMVGMMLGGGVFLFTDHAIGIWLLVLSLMTDESRQLQELEPRYYRLLRGAFEGRIVQFLAQRSYSTYLLHYPLLLMIGAVATHYMHVSSGLRLAAALLVVLPMTLLFQEPLYRWVEVPGQAYGRRWAKALGEPPIVEVAVDLP